MAKAGFDSNPMKYKLLNPGLVIFDDVKNIIKEHEVIFVDQVYKLTGKKCIVPASNLAGIEGFMEDGVAYTMKELLGGKMGKPFTDNINGMIRGINITAGRKWLGAEGYIKIPFTSYTDKGIVYDVTKESIEKAFAASISKKSYIQNNGALGSITIFLEGSPPFKLDISKLK